MSFGWAFTIPRRPGETPDKRTPDEDFKVPNNNSQNHTLISMSVEKPAQIAADENPNGNPK